MLVTAACTSNDMKRNLYGILSLLAVVAMGSCSSNEDGEIATYDNAEAISYLTLLPSLDYDSDIADVDSVTSRTEETKIDLPSGTVIGVFLLEHPKNHHQLEVNETYIPYSPPDLNIKGTYSGNNKWTFSYSNTLDATFPDLFITRGPQEDKTADLYAYAPWDEDVENLRAVSIKRGIDFLYPEENGATTTGTTDQNTDKSNKNLEPLTEAYCTNNNKVRNYTIPLTFRHAMSLLQLRLKVRSNATDELITDDSTDKGINHNVVLSKVVVTILENETNLTFYESGIFDTFTGLWSSKIGSDKYLITGTDGKWDGTTSDGNWYLTPNYGNLYFYLVPCLADNETDDDDTPVMQFDISLNRMEKNEGEITSYTYTVTRKEMRRSIDSDYGLRQGYRYIFSFYIENYLHLENVLIDTSWVDAQGTEIKI